MSHLISVIITTKNEQNYIESCLKSIKNQTYKPIEIIVSDSCSTDDTVKIAKKYADKVVVKKTNIPKGKNLGVKYAKGKILIFVDGDTILSKKFIERAVKNLRKNDFTVGILKPQEKNWKAEFTCILWSKFLPKLALFMRMPAFPGCSVFCMKREIFKKISGFDEKMDFLEDVNFSRRIAKIGKIKWDKNLVSYTSMRKFEKEGYLKWFFLWFVFLIWYLITGKPLIKSYKHIR